MADIKFEMTAEKLAKLKQLFGEAVEKFPAEMLEGAEKAISKEMAKESAIDNVYEHFIEDELKSFREDIDEDSDDKEAFIHTLENHILHSLIVMRFGEEGATKEMEKLWFKYGGPRYSFKKTIKENGKEKDIIEYGEVQHSTILEIFGHLMFYDDLKLYAKDPDASTFLTGEFDWGDRASYDFWLSVYANTKETDDVSKLLYQGKFQRYGMSMEPFITLQSIEDRLEAEEDEEKGR
jgi:hypothetical protein